MFPNLWEKKLLPIQFCSQAVGGCRFRNHQRRVWHWWKTFSEHDILRVITTDRLSREKTLWRESLHLYLFLHQMFVQISYRWNVSIFFNQLQLHEVDTQISPIQLINVSELTYMWWKSVKVFGQLRYRQRNDVLKQQSNGKYRESGAEWMMLGI